jgi:FkbM family methyltransferase
MKQRHRFGFLLCGALFVIVTWQCFGSDVIAAVAPPLEVQDGVLYLRHESAELARVGPLDDAASAHPTFAFGNNVRRVAVDVGTNVDPDTFLAFWGSEPDMGFVWVEPVPAYHVESVSFFPVNQEKKKSRPRLFALNAAVGPTRGFTTMHVSEEAGCSSLLMMNRQPTNVSDELDRRCFTKSREARVAVVRGDDIAALIPTDITWAYLGVDAQGFDLHVLSSFAGHIHRVSTIMVECQDLPLGDARFLTRGSFSCAEIIACLATLSPEHQLVHPLTGKPQNYCAYNSPRVEEFNCVFHRPDRPFWATPPPILTIHPGRSIEHPVRNEFRCPI